MTVEPAQDRSARSVSSPYPFQETVDRLVAAIAAEGMTMIAKVDQAAGAREAGFALNDSTLLIFGHPSAGAPILAAAPLSALDLPPRLLVWTTERGAVRVSFQDTEDFRDRHGVSQALMSPLVRCVSHVVVGALRL